MIEKLALGTARWGSEIDIKTVFKLLDRFVESGGRYIDSATNYPINGVAEDFGLANKILSKWISLNLDVDLSIFVKLGSVSNSGGPESDLSAERIYNDFESLHHKFGKSFGGVGVHWDNRGIDKVEQIKETIQQLALFHKNGFRIGISGLREVGTYSSLAPSLQNVWEIQVKEKVNDHSIRDSYLSFFPYASYFVYGINGRRLLSSASIQGSKEVNRQSEQQESNADRYFLWIKTILDRNGVDKVIIGPRTLQQLDSVLIRTHRIPEVLGQEPIL
jgi:aryl-alcohol dehydrogenase-like predicted oxidoreductase